MHKLLSIEDVEKIMEETQEGIEYQRVSIKYMQQVVNLGFKISHFAVCCLQSTFISKLSILNFTQAKPNSTL